VELAGPVIAKIRKAVPFLPADDEVIVRANGAIQSAAGVLIAVGICQTVSALALVGSLIPTTLAGHRFWDELDPERAAQQRTHFLKNLGLLGGLAMAATETPTRHTKDLVQQTKDTVVAPASRVSALVHRHTS
jgi:uncharacterized membrane protein YphA (DoxX/SURF4 family)